jgi:UDP-N-acetylmuramoyl-tripeptide--D-alanyl-D-alanine ligase
MVAEAHLEGFGSLQGVAEAMGEIYSALTADGVAVVNGDEPYGALWHQLSNAGLVLSFGGGALADVSVSQQHCQTWLGESAAGSRFQLNLPQGAVAINLPIPGWHNVMNAAAAAAVATALTVPAEKIVAGLETAENVSGRLDIQRLANGAALVDDSYNANPASIKAAAEWLLSIDGADGSQGRQLLVLGEMAELGAESETMHRQLGSDLAAAGLAELRTTGGAGAQALAEGFGQVSSYFEDRNLLVTSLAAELQADDVVLVKGSRSAAMEQVAHQLTAVMAGQTAAQLSESSGA